MLHLLYILAFTVIAFLAVSNLIRSLISVSMGTQKRPSFGQRTAGGKTYHPEMFDDQGNPINEPLLVIRSVNVDDARQKLDALYNASPEVNVQDRDDDIN